LGDGLKVQVILIENGYYNFQTMSANRPKADTRPPEPVGSMVAYRVTYTVDEGSKTVVSDIERSSFPQWDGLIHTILSIETPSAAAASNFAPD
jgi:hypothetical protein